MKIFIMRHGEAAEIAGDDCLRPLTEQGALETKLMGKWLLDNKHKRLSVFVSPYLRAQQTCANVSSLLLKESWFMNQPETLDFISPSGNVKHAHDFLDGVLSEINDSNIDVEPSILFVSHMPFVSYFVAELTDKIQMPIFPTGAIAVIDYDTLRMQGQLLGMVSPQCLNLK